jgi:hypothetical protein
MHTEAEGRVWSLYPSGHLPGLWAEARVWVCTQQLIRSPEAVYAPLIAELNSFGATSVIEQRLCG